MDCSWARSHSLYFAPPKGLSTANHVYPAWNPSLQACSCDIFYHGSKTLALKLVWCYFFPNKTSKTSFSSRLPNWTCLSHRSLENKVCKKVEDKKCCITPNWIYSLDVTAMWLSCIIRSAGLASHISSEVSQGHWWLAFLFLFPSNTSKNTTLVQTSMVGVAKREKTV